MRRQNWKAAVVGETRHQPGLDRPWHNARGGYRAQYYVDAAMGDDANAFARRVLAPTATRLIQCDPTDSSSCRRASPRSHTSPRGFGCIKVDGFATAERLTASYTSADGSITLARPTAPSSANGPPTPRDETGLAPKGQWIDNGKPVAKVPKSARGRQLHRLRVHLKRLSARAIYGVDQDTQFLRTKRRLC